MALPMLAGGSECGPSNALQNLSKRFEQDRGAQQDFFGAGRAGSSQQAFRSQNASGSGQAVDHEAARFFGANPAAAAGALAQDGAAHFDLSALRQSLPMQHQVQVPQMQQQPMKMDPSAWAMDFMQQTPIAQSQIPQQQQQHQPMQPQNQAHASPMHPSPLGMQQGWTPSFRMNTMPSFMPQLQVQPQPQVLKEQISWDKEFSALEMDVVAAAAAPLAAEPIQQQPEPVVDSRNRDFEADDIARTAGELLSSLRHEQNPKFQQSQFLGLMRQLRDGEVIVEGDKMVESDGTRTSTSANVDVKGKGRALDPSLRSVNNTTMGPMGVRMGQTAQVNDPLHAAMRDSSDVVVGEDPNDAYFRQENAEFKQWWSELGDQTKATHTGALGGTEAMAWNHLQEDWDKFEATTTGISSVNRYQFQQNNPYLLGESSKSRHHLLHGGGRQAVLESVLELEAAVQRDMTNAGLWYELGVRQQENEREQKALQALERAVELESSLLPAWLALAISYTNDNNRQGTYDAISAWVNRNAKYAPAVIRFHAQNPYRVEAPIHEKYTQMIECLIAMARSDTAGEVDADIQIALAVLLNTNEEYEKAQDCFKTALAVRPDDWLLYNRVGATMANSGQAEEALQYYYKALELNPGYIRARFNLGISCINLRRYEEATGHILDALLLQDGDSTASEGVGNEQTSGISNALWDSLKTGALHMQRADLATLCDLKDLDGFRKRFYG